MVRRSTLTVFLAIALGTIRASDDPGFVPLFDGESLAGWTSIGGKPGNWRAEGGMLVTRGDGKGWLSTNRSYRDFVLRLEYRTGPSGNSGVLIRAPHTGDPSFDGMEVQVLDDDAPAYRGLQPSQYSGSVYGVLASKRGHVRPPGEWNSLLVRAEGPRVVVELNGVVVVDGDVSDRPDLEGKHPGVKRSAGFLGLQSHSEPVQFRKVEIREIR